MKASGTIPCAYRLVQWLTMGLGVPSYAALVAYILASAYL